MHRARALAPVVIVSCFAAQALAQAPIRHVDGLSAGERLGMAVSAAGDINGDGVPDLIVGAPYANVAGPASGRVLVVAGATGSVIHALGGAAAGDLLGCSVAGVGDVTGDGVPDLLIGARGDDVGGANAGAAFLVSGATGSVVWVVRGQAGDNLGAAALGLGDVNGDGVPDVAIGAWTADANGKNSGAVRILSGTSGALLRVIAGEAAYDHFGGALALAGDLDGDGIDDLLVGARWNASAGPGAGSAYVHSAVSGARLRTLRGAVAGEAFGVAVAGLGDVTGDGVPDLAVGVPSARVNGLLTGAVRIFSGADGGLVRTLGGLAQGDAFGSALAAFDLDQDGILDLAVGAPGCDENGPNAGSVSVHSGSDGAPLVVIRGGLPGDRYGSALDPTGDVSGDGRTELAVGAYGTSGKGAMTGAAAIVSFGLPGLANYCVAEPNSTGLAARIGHRGSVSVAAENLRLVARQLPTQQLGLFFYGPNAIQVPFADGFLCVGGSIFRLPIVPTDPTGTATSTVTYLDPTQPAGEIHPGSTWRFQFWFRDAKVGGAGTNFSDALSITFVP